MQNQPLQYESDISDQENIVSQPLKPHYIVHPQEFLLFCINDKKIKIMNECNPIWNNVYLKDISLHKKGPLQDKIYSKVEKYYRNIRRGNTLCQIYEEKQIDVTSNEYKMFFCRRGMKKFYDLEPEYLKVGANLSTQHQRYRKRIFQGVEQIIENGKAKVHIYCLFKQNGEHCQIGFIKQLDGWLFSSKNVAILARNINDLQEHYHKERFYWAKLIGQQFFKILQSFSLEQVQSFKNDIEGYTLLGEHCGNDQHQHITKYNQVQIIFYGLVKNTGFDHCQPVDDCQRLLKKYGLKMSSYISKKGLLDKNTIFSSMYEMLKEVAQGKMQEKGQGSVMYIVCQEQGKQRTIGMCKLKTCQYLIYRRLREMLKLNVNKKGLTANTFEKYKFQIENLVIHYFKPPKTLDYYYRLAERAFKEIGSNVQIDQKYLRYHFVDLLDKFQKEQQNKALQNIQNGLQIKKNAKILIISLPRISNTFEKYCKNLNFQIDYMFRSQTLKQIKNIVHVLYMIPRLPDKIPEDLQIIIINYTPEQIKHHIQQIKQCKDLSRSQLITFLKSQDKDKVINMLYEKIKAFKSKCKTENIPFLQIDDFTEQKLIGLFRQIVISQKKIMEIPVEKEISPFKKYIVLPLLLPGSGKSTFAKTLLQKDTDSKINWKILDSDKIRRQEMQKVGNVDLNAKNNLQLFIKSKQSSHQRFHKELLQYISNKPQQNEYLYVDRIYSPYNIEAVINLLLDLQNKDYVKIIVLTQRYSSVKLNEHNYPYSLHYLLTCLKRCLEREQHKTMPNNPYDVAKIVLKFYQMAANYNEKTLYKLYSENINILKFQFVAQHENSKYTNLHLKEKIEQCLKLIEPGKGARDSNSFIELVELMYKYMTTQEKPSLLSYNHFRTQIQAQILKL